MRGFWAVRPLLLALLNFLYDSLFVADSTLLPISLSDCPTKFFSAWGRDAIASIITDRKEKRKTQKSKIAQRSGQDKIHVSRHITSPRFLRFWPISPSNQFWFIIERKRITQSVETHHLQLLQQLRNRFYIGEPEKRQNTFERENSIE